MILLDTNVLSEMMRPCPEGRVVRWLDAQPDDDVWISALTVAEIRMGIVLLPAGRRKSLLLETKGLRILIRRDEAMPRATPKQTFP